MSLISAFLGFLHVRSTSKSFGRTSTQPVHPDFEGPERLKTARLPMQSCVEPPRQSKRAIEDRFETCVMCGRITNILRKSSIQQRRFYVAGVGQLCMSCAEELPR